VQKADNERRVSELQDKILNQIASQTGDILEDDELVVTLDESKDQCKQIEQQLKEMESTMKQIETIREIFVPVAVRVSRLFFVLSDLMNVDPMY
jgi:dynein heavy chain